MQTPEINKSSLADMLAKIRAEKINIAPHVLVVNTSTNTAPKTMDVMTRMSATNPLLEKLRAQYKKEHEPAPIVAPAQPEAGTFTYPVINQQTTNLSTTDKHGNLISYNSKQQEFVTLASTGKSCVLIGAAGTGKTTSMKGTLQALITNNLAGVLEASSHKHLFAGAPGIVICAYTRRAVANIRKNLSTDLQGNCITIHKLLEYAPEYVEVLDEETGQSKTKMSFEPSRTAYNPIPPSVKVLVFEESSMIGTDLFKQVIDACPHKPQMIFLGDIQQLPPVFGPAVLGFKLNSLPVVELTEVYRQALESPIISLAHRILSGKALPDIEFPKWKFPDKLTIHPWKKRISAEDGLKTAGAFFTKALDGKLYDPEQDAILLPFNKSFGTDELNKIIANHIARKNNAETYEIVAGFERHYLSVGDKVLYEKEDATILAITPNPSYTGAKYLPHSPTLDYWGHDPILRKRNDDEVDDFDVDFLLTQVAATDTDRVRQASHKITLKVGDNETPVSIDKASELNALLLGYALTVHKSQGSEWRKVFLVIHQSHATMTSRELLYTAVTRAKEELYIICEPDTFVKGIASQRVKGNTLAEKAEVFKGKLNSGEDYSFLMD